MSWISLVLLFSVLSVGPAHAQESEFELLAEVTDSNLELWTTNWIRRADFLYEYANGNMDYFLILDLRRADDFALGRIESAINTTLETLISDAETHINQADYVVCVCYTGQESSFATMALRMLGYDAFAIKYGMAGWNTDFIAPWEDNISNQWASEFVFDDSEPLPWNEWPVLNTGLETGPAILEARIEAVLAEGFAPNAITATEVFDGLEGYSIFNYWSEWDYSYYGHIPTAYQLDLSSLQSSENLSAFDPNGENVIYCWTGQTSALNTFYLNVMGYDMRAVEFGANAMIYDELESHDWPIGGYGYDFPYIYDVTIESQPFNGPQSLELQQNYPNPFNPMTTISFSLPTSGEVSLRVFDLSGRLVEVLLDGWQTDGEHEVIFSGQNHASGLYVYQLVTQQQCVQEKMLLIK